MKKSALRTEDKKPDSAILIVDKIGVIGEELSLEFSKDYYVVFLSSRIPKKINEKTSFIKFEGKIPKVPKNKYSKIFLIDDGTSITKESSFSFVDEAKELGADFYFLGSVRNFDIKHSDELANSYSKSKVLVFGDLFDEKFLFDHDASITKFIIEASNRKKIKVPGEGLSLSYPITFEDTIKLILRASYINIPQKIILLFYKNPITDISLAHLFQKIDPEIRVDYVKEYREQNLYIPDGAEYAISKYNIKKRINEINLNEPKKIIANKKKKRKNKLNVFKLLLFLVLVLFFIIFLPFSTMQIYGYLGENEIKNASILIRESEFENALKKSEKAQTFFTISNNAAKLVTSQLSLVNKKEEIKGLAMRNELGIIVSGSMQDFLEGIMLIDKIYKGDSINEKEEFKKGMDLIKSSYSEIQKQNDFNKETSKMFMLNEKVYNQMDLFLSISESLPFVLGLEGKKTYLVLFQDSNELRPGGGRISSIGKFTIENLNIENFEITDVKKLDKELDVRVEPPFPIRRYLPSSDYFLEDSSFDPDFVKSAISASALYKLEGGEEVDGIIGVDLYFLKNLLEGVGPVYLEEVDKNVTDENLFQLASEFEEKENDDYFITKLLEKIILVLDQGEGLSLYPPLTILEKSIQEKHMLFAFKEPDIQKVFITNDFSSSLVDNRLEIDNKLNDYFGISEANLGKNKINFYISRSISKKNIISSSGDLSSEATIAFKNSSKKGSSFSDTYKNYIQLILPKKARLNNIFINGKRQEIIPAINDYTVYEDRRFRDPEELEVDQEIKANKNIYSFLIYVTPDSIETIKINYDTDFKISTDSNTPSDYSLQIYKQPGIGSFPFNLTFSQDGTFLISPEDSYSIDIKKDELIENTITKK